MNLLTESRLKTRRRCAREHHLRYDLGYQPVESRETLRFGTLVHAALEAWWRATQDRLASASRAIAEHATPETDAYEQVKAEELLRGYDARWGGEKYTTLAVEEEFRAPVINPETGAASKTWQLAGKLDVRAIDQAGRPVIVEHKTSSEDIGPGSNYWARLRMDGQVSLYFRGAEAVGHPVEACLYDVLGKPKLRPLKATAVEARKHTKDGRLYANQRLEDETPEEYRVRLREHIAANPDAYYQRGEVVRLESELREHEADTWAMAQMMRDERRLGLAPKNPDACVRWSSLCPYFAACSGEASLDDERLYQILPSVHPELTEQPAPNGAHPKEEGQPWSQQP